MARSGIGAQLGIAAESTYGTYIAPARFLEFVSEDLALELGFVESNSLRVNQRVQRSDHWATGKRNVSGGIEFEIPNKNFGLLFKHALGGAAVVADGTGWKHTFTLADPFGLSLTCQVGRPDVSNTTNPFNFLGCVVEEWEFTAAVEELAMFNLTVNGRDLETTTALASATAPTVTEFLSWAAGAFTIDAGAVPIKEFKLSGSNGYDLDRYFLGSALKSAPILNERAALTGTATLEFTSLAEHTKFAAGTMAALVVTVAGVTTYDTAKPYKLVCTLPKVRYDALAPTVGGTEIIEQEIEFTVLDDGSNPPVKFEYFTSDATP